MTGKWGGKFFFLCRQNIGRGEKQYPLAGFEILQRFEPATFISAVCDDKHATVLRLVKYKMLEQWHNKDIESNQTESILNVN